MNLEEHKEHTFDAYCKRIVKNEATSVYREYQQQIREEVTFSDLTPKELQQLQYTDQYAPDRQIFSFLGMEVEVLDGDLARALEMLTPERRAIVMLAYLLGMKDPDIARLFQLKRTTVRSRRVSILKELRKIMEGYENE